MDADLPFLSISLENALKELPDLKASSLSEIIGTGLHQYQTAGFVQTACEYMEGSQLPTAIPAIFWILFSDDWQERLCKKASLEEIVRRPYTALRALNDVIPLSEFTLDFDGSWTDFEAEFGHSVSVFPMGHDIYDEDINQLLEDGEHYGAAVASEYEDSLLGHYCLAHCMSGDYGESVFLALKKIFKLPKRLWIPTRHRELFDMNILSRLCLERGIEDLGMAFAFFAGETGNPFLDLNATIFDSGSYDDTVGLSDHPLIISLYNSAIEAKAYSQKMGTAFDRMRTEEERIPALRLLAACLRDSRIIT